MTRRRRELKATKKWNPPPLYKSSPGQAPTGISKCVILRKPKSPWEEAESTDPSDFVSRPTSRMGPPGPVIHLETRDSYQWEIHVGAHQTKEGHLRTEMEIAATSTWSTSKFMDLVVLGEG
eukprot:CAMPEP_0194288572 /NCGR_PEP_ID=MMETSP0169-20130528/37095_1 /TAXON_ID=218684 /ORGANISM="Corethron pennatum, Strain L29A3" /LENGTH=120 /DNA_ID=CAMNT_0039035617 /DNA_START=100 /DNA_END=462 /DNA_ORIENTATION=+